MSEKRPQPLPRPEPELERLSRPRTPVRRPETATPTLEDLVAEVDDLRGHVVFVDAMVSDYNRNLRRLEATVREHERAYHPPTTELRGTGGSDRPSETSISLRPTRARIQLKNWRPTATLVTLVLGVLGLLIVAGLLAVWLFGHKGV